MRWWLTENGGRQPYPMSCLAAIAATVLCVLSILNLCATITLANPMHVNNVEHILDLNSGPSGPSRTDRSTINELRKSRSAGTAIGGDLRDFYSGRTKKHAHSDRQLQQGEWEEQNGRHLDRRQRYGSYKDSLSRRWKSNKRLEGSDLDRPQSRAALEPLSFCNKTDSHSLLVCAQCDNTQPCQVDSIPHKTGGVCVLREEGGHTVDGCSFDCQMSVRVPECCDGFWGSQCLPCPGGVNNVCNGRGDCQDRISGNGDCLCNNGFTGVACELCEDVNMYGPLCNQECGCVYGMCSTGPSGDGSCQCRPGYQGDYCDQEDNVCVHLECHLNAHCEMMLGSRDLTCVCNSGYEGDGSDCQEQRIHCGSLLCHPEAFCSTQGNCVCNRDYHGDGVECIPVNHCQENNGGCPLQSSFCLYDGPGEFHCECRHGYEDFQRGRGCTVIDMCADFNTPECPPHSTCVMGRPGITNCQCQSGYISVGDNCYGHIMETLEDLSSTGGEGIQGQLHTSIALLQHAGLATLLNGHQLFTIFIPTDEAYLQEDKQQILTKARNDSDFANYLMKLHILPTYINSTSLTQAQDVYTMTGLMAEVTPSSKDPTTLRYRLEGSNNKGIITHPDLLAFNGIIHIIDTLMYEPPVIENNVTASIFDVISHDGRFNRLENALRNTRLDQSLHGPGYFTFFAPYNKAFDNLPDGTMDFLFSEQGKDTLDALLRNLMVQGDTMRVQDLLNFPSNFNIITLYGSAFTIRTTAKGQIYLTGPVNLTITDIRTRNGIIHVIDGLIVPPDLEPLLPHKCNTVQWEPIQGICSSCEDKKSLRCPDGTAPTFGSDVQRGCVYEEFTDGLILPEIGCALTCNRTTVTEECCHGFYGESCLPCPGGFQTPCRGHGQCDGTKAGNGHCTCEVNFAGTACELCARQDRYGPRCEQMCTCQHGVCDNGPLGTGICRPYTCALGFLGDNCDQPLHPCDPEQNPCHLYATCHMDGNRTRCVCGPGYEGNGLDCTFVDVCEQPAKGNCHIEAHCIYLGNGQHRCECNRAWIGDGYECIISDLCALEDRGGCHSNATCNIASPGENTCKCKPGFVGSGQYCEPIDMCSRSNGGCHPQAVCTNLYPGVQCRCQRGYAGDGLVCYSNVAYELSTLSNASIFYALIGRAKLERTLASIPAVTGFIPSNAAFDNLSEEQQDILLAGDGDFIEKLVRKHFLRNMYMKEDLLAIADGTESWLPTIDDEISLLIRRCAEDVCVDQLHARVIRSDIIASNGIIQLIDKILFPAIPFIDDGDDSWQLPNQPAYYQSLQQAMEPYSKYQNFTQLLEKHGLLDMLDQADAYTVFMPGNLALASFPVSLQNQDLLKLHIILGVKLQSSEIKDGMHLDSYLGHNYQLRFHVSTNFNARLIDVNKVPIVDADIQTDKGVVHGLIDVINPVPNHCDVNRTSYTQSPCVACNSVQDCPMGTVYMGDTTECHYTTELFGRKVEMEGCTVQCKRIQYIPQCCPGFFGNDCEECPESWRNPCESHGTCQDGINGTGKCECHPGFTGTACEACERNKYGIQCQEECHCLHGSCNDGIEGDGQCRCNRGWAGQLCNISVAAEVGQPCDPECDSNAYCVDGQCICFAGFTGDGLACAALDPCHSEPCSMFATCSAQSNGRYLCQCNNGYQGDGAICIEENPCENGQSGCHVHAECIHTGAALSACVCLAGYEGDGRQRCQAINACQEDNGGCDIRAQCTTSGPGQRVCNCFEGHVGDGFTCTGSMLEELNMMPQFSQFSFMLNGDERLRLLLAMNGPFTLFAPTNEAMEDVTQDQNSNDDMFQILLYHIITCQALDAETLSTRSSWITLAGQPVRVTQNQEKGLRINVHTSVVATNIASTNGIIHGINKLLTPSSTFGRPSRQVPTFEELARNGSYNIFLELMQKSGVDAEFNSLFSIPATLFVPSDASFGLLPPGRLDQLRDDINIMMMKEFVQYHFVPNMKLHVADFAASPDGQRFTTLQGSQISIGCQRDLGGIYINDASQIEVFEHRFQEGLFYGIDRVLEPPSIGGRCDEISFETQNTPCKRCSSLFRCPPEFVPRGSLVPDCHYSAGWLHTEEGCYQECVRQHTVPKCCTNHYGSDCRECPGGSRTPCSGHGLCSDGHDAVGQCTCESGFKGTACGLCTEGRYGLDCLECQCGRNGICSEGRHGTGECFCLPGWKGQFCDVPIKIQPVCNPACHPHNAVCREGNRCECYPRYYDNGRDCEEINQCAFNNGGCSPYATCSQTNGEVSCECLSDYEGDGVYCRPIDRCQEQNGGCAENAVCIMTGPNIRTCECSPPLVGDGYVFCGPPPQYIFKCSIDNGGCSENAWCFESAVDRNILTHGHTGVISTEPGEDKARDPYGPRYRRQSDLPPYLPLDPNQPVTCLCKDGYVGNGTLCNGNMLETLASIPVFSQFYQALIRYSQQNKASTGMGLLDDLQSRYSSLTVFVPMGEEFGNQTEQVVDVEAVPFHIVEMKVNRFGFYDNMTMVTWKQTSILKVEQTDEADSGPEFSVNGVNITFYDIPTTNGYIHVVQRPLPVRSEAKKQDSDRSHPPSSIVAYIVLSIVALIVLCIICIIVIQYKARRRKRPEPPTETSTRAVYSANDDDNDGAVTFTHSRDIDECGVDTYMTDTDDGGATDMESPDYVIGDITDDTVAFVELDFTGASHV